MYALAILGVLACVSAAPRHHHRHDDFAMKSFYGDSVFDTKQFWSELSTEMARFDQMLQELMAHFPRSSSTAGVKDNQYVIAIALDGFKEKDIVVKAREGLVMVQAVTRLEGGGERSYLDVRNLPENVNPAGNWIYEQGVLKMAFPLKKGTPELTDGSSEVTGTTEVSTEVISTQEPTTEAPRDREEIESQEGHSNMDADVGLEGDAELLTNEISQHNSPDAVEATTYAVDVRSDFDFVPVSYK